MKNIFGKALLLAVIVLPALPGLAQETPNGKELQFFPKGHLFDPVYLDPTENQIQGGMYSYWINNDWQDKLYASFALGFQREILRWEKNKAHLFSFGISATTFTQFELIEPTGVSLSNLLNNDFKVGGQFSYRSGNVSMRIRYWHVSTHLGDDFIFRYNIPGWYINPVIYEQIDLLLSEERKHFRYYGGFGIVTNSTYARKRASLHWGFSFNKALKNDYFRWIAGVDVRMLEHFNYRPNVNLAAGLEIGERNKHPIRVMLQYYNGHLPYSWYEYLSTQWLGLSMSFSAF